MPASLILNDSMLIRFFKRSDFAGCGENSCGRVLENTKMPSDKPSCKAHPRAIFFSFWKNSCNGRSERRFFPALGRFYIPGIGSAGLLIWGTKKKRRTEIKFSLEFSGSLSERCRRKNQLSGTASVSLSGNRICFNFKRMVQRKKGKKILKGGFREALEEGFAWKHRYGRKREGFGVREHFRIGVPANFHAKRGRVRREEPNPKYFFYTFSKRDRSCTNYVFSGNGTEILMLKRWKEERKSLKNAITRITATTKIKWYVWHEWYVISVRFGFCFTNGRHSISHSFISSCASPQ